MGRLTNWLDQDTQDAETELAILYDQAVSVDVFRYNEADDNPGVTSEVDDSVYLRTINVRLDKSQYRSDKFDLIGLTDDHDVQQNDRWKYTPPRGVAIMLQVIRVEYRKSGNHVELKYD